MSQRLFIFALEIVKIVVIGISAYTTGKGITTGSDFNGTLLLLAVPVTLISTTILAFYKTLDARVADTTLDPKDFLGMLGLSGFWIMEVSTLSAELTIFGYAFIPPEAQTVVVGMFQGLSMVIIWSLTGRAAGDDVTSREKAATAQYERRREEAAETSPSHGD